MGNWMWAVGAGGVAVALGLVLLAVAAFFVLRWVLLWYWRVNEQLLLLREIRDLLRGAPSAAREEPAPREVAGHTEPGLPRPVGTDDPVAAVVARLRRGQPAG